MTQQANEEQKRCFWWDTLSPTAFTIASVDILICYKVTQLRIYRGNQHRSYHGTTVQVIQPNLGNEIHHGYEEQATSSSATFYCQIISHHTVNFITYQNNHMMAIY